MVNPESLRAARVGSDPGRVRLNLTLSQNQVGMKLSPRLGLFLGLLALAGCGDSAPSRGSVTGKVTVAGKGPLTGGSIRFELVSDSKLFGSGQILADGSYECADAPVGECRVVVENQHLQAGGATPGKLPGGGTMPGMAKGGGVMGSGGPGSGKSPSEATKKMGNAPKGADVPAGMNDGPSSVGMKYVKVDAKYASPTETPVKFPVAKGKNTFDFEVK